MPNPGAESSNPSSMDATARQAETSKFQQHGRTADVGLALYWTVRLKATDWDAAFAPVPVTTIV